MSYYNYGIMAASYGLTASRQASNQRYVRSTGARTSLQKTRAYQSALPAGRHSRKSTYISSRGINYGGRKKLTKQQQSRLNRQQRALYQQRRRNVMYNRAGTALLAASLAPYAVRLGVRTLGYTNTATGQPMGKKTYVVGGLKRTGSYWTRQGKRANYAVRIPRRVAQGVPGRAPRSSRLAIPARTGSRYTRFKQAQRTFTVRSGRVRRDYKGRFAGWY